MLLHQNNIHMEILTSVLTSRLSGGLMMQSAEMCLTVFFLCVWLFSKIFLSFQGIIFTDTAVFFVNKNTILGGDFISCQIVCCSGNHTTVGQLKLLKSYTYTIQFKSLGLEKPV